jgi:hypothetical protein
MAPKSLLICKLCSLIFHPQTKGQLFTGENVIPVGLLLILILLLEDFCSPKKPWMAITCPLNFLAFLQPCRRFFSHLLVAAMFAQNLFILMACCLYLISCFYQ